MVAPHESEDRIRLIGRLPTPARRWPTESAPSLAACALEARLVDEYQLIIRPVLVGGGKPALTSHLRADLELLDTRRFNNGVVHLRYRIRC